MQRPEDVVTPKTRRHSRDVQALHRCEIFLVYGVSTVILVRTFLVATGYPQVGGGGLHVAHVLYGGLLMAVAMVIVLTNHGSRAKTRGAAIGGIGFGLFIDEVGKFLTKDVNYFFKPAIAIIYATFVLFYIIAREVVLRRELNDRHRLAIASTALADLALGQLGAHGRQHALEGLESVSSHHGLAAALRNGLLADSPAAERRLIRIRDRQLDRVHRSMAHPHFHHWLLTVFLLQAAGVLAELALLISYSATNEPHASSWTVRSAAISAGITGCYTLFGVVRLIRHDREGAIRVLTRSVLVTLLVTQVLVFAEYELSGVIGLFFELGILALLGLATEHHPVAAAQRARASQAAPIAPVPSQTKGAADTEGMKQIQVKKTVRRETEDTLDLRSPAGRTLPY
jgi:hypothetical protein